MAVAGHVETESFEVPDPGPGQVLVRVSRSQVSAGSEKTALLAARGERRPLGYTLVGTVQACGPGVDAFRVEGRVLAFGNHGSHWLTAQSGLSELRTSVQPIEHDAAELSDEQATFAVLGDVALLGIRRAELQIDESVAVFDQGQRPSHCSFGGYVSDYQSVGATRKASVGDQRHRISQSLADQGCSRREHLAHSRPSLGAFVANHQHIAGAHFVSQNCLQRLFLAVVDAGRTAHLAG